MDLSDQKTQLMLLGVLAGVGLLYAWFTYLYTPRNERIGELQGELQMVQGEVQALEVKVRQLPEVQSRLAEVEEQWARVLVSFPTEPREAEVFGALTTAEQRSGLFIQQISKGERRTQPLYFEQDYGLVMVGRYHQLGGFIANISNQPRRMSVQRIQLQNPAYGELLQGAAPPQEGEVIIRCTVTVYTARGTG